MTRLAEVIGAIVAVSAWLAGIVLAKGWASTTASVLFPPWAWYLLAERLMRAAGLV